MPLSVRNKVTADPASGNGKPTVTHYDGAVEEFLTHIRQAAVLVPFLKPPHPTTSTFVNVHKNVPTAFVRTVANAVGNNEQMQALQPLDVAAAKDAIQYEAAFAPAADEVLTLYRSMRFTLDNVKANVGADALQAYRVVKAVAVTTENAPLMEEVLRMRRDLGRVPTKPRAKKGGTKETPPPVSKEAATDKVTRKQ
ncbi:MAG: hypothetical protein JWO56_1161 [Acidobacteria bacterium]|nr:hypothetical protein [Acidobacteriota bacterium]